MFLLMLEGIHPQDAQIVVDMINKKTPKGLTRQLLRKLSRFLYKVNDLNHLFNFNTNQSVHIRVRSFFIGNTNGITQLERLKKTPKN